MTIFMETTRIEVKATVAEIQAFLVKAGARSIQVNYGSDGEPDAVKFMLVVNGAPVLFLLPARKEPIFKHLNKKRPPERQQAWTKEDWEQAARVAWRQIRRWVEAQFALIQTGMAEPQEVFLPYWVGANDVTFYQALKEQSFKGLLPPAEVHDGT